LGDAVDFVTFGTTRTRGGAPLKADARMVETASLRVTSPDGTETVHALFDDGLHRDGEAGDGVFGGSFRPETEGLYNAQVVARGVTRDGRPFTRTAEHVVPVIARRMALPLDVATARLVDDRRFAVSIAIDNAADAPAKYRVFAEVWGADAAGTMQPVSWIGGMSYVDDGRLDLGLDARWIGRSKARSDFELRNLRIEDPDTFVAVAQVDRMALDTPVLPPIARRVPKAIDQEMLVGPRPAQNIDKAGGRLLLVHGYCSSNVWGPQAGQFSNESIFLDLDKNRSHDQFAIRIGNFGSAWSSFGVVAHSQGGAASLHLYTYYWSGLDNASGGRLIQSVGTPYQGTSLAGNAAVLGQIFGIGCGTNTDLTYSGASSWLSGIPSWARNAVNYYTTSFKDNWWSYDYCNIVTDLLLNDPDDGTTEKAKGQLSSGVNRGHKSGWCHTSGMADPAQTTDGGRNSSMNSNAAN
ncbi:MAG: choice-of-anchor X domain-containing protein, partial [Acidobacteriota bacterium]